MRGDAEWIRREVTAWARVEAHAPRFGGTEYRYGCKEIGQVHATGWLTCTAAKASGRADRRRAAPSPAMLPDTALIGCWLDCPEGQASGVTLSGGSLCPSSFDERWSQCLGSG